jgi:hypothetical protein
MKLIVAVHEQFPPTAEEVEREAMGREAAEHVEMDELVEEDEMDAEGPARRRRSSALSDEL